MIDRALFVAFGQEIASAIAGENRRRGLLLSDFPRLTQDGFDVRTRAILAGRGIGPVNFPSALKALIKQRFPGLGSYSRQGDNHQFAQKLADDLIIAVVFERIHHFGLGKAFTVHLVCEQFRAGEPPFLCKHSLFNFFDRSPLEWTYGRCEDLDVCFDEAATLLDYAFPPYLEGWQTVYQTGSSGHLSALAERGALSFREAADIAYEAVQPSSSAFSHLDAAWLMRGTPIVSPSESLAAAGSAAFSGRLAPDLSWNVRFADVGGEKTLTVVVPYRGRLAFVQSSTLGINRDGVHHLVRASASPTDTLALPPPSVAQAEGPRTDLSWDKIADSTDVMATTIRAGGKAFHERHPDCAVQLQLSAEVCEPPTEDEFWYVHYFVRDGGRRADLAFRVAARDLRILERRS